MIKAYWHKAANVGDTLTKPIVEWITGQEVRVVERGVHGKLIGVGSIMTAVREHDVVWGTGILNEGERDVPHDVTFLAVRGPLTRAMIRNAKVPEVYGDPGLLLPKIYDVTRSRPLYKLGIVPHYVDRKFVDLMVRQTAFKERFADAMVIDVALPWQQFVDRILCCEKIISSSLHGIVIAEAYGIPAEWAVYSDGVIGKGFKFRDYFRGTGREIDEPGELPPIEGLKERQAALVGALKNYYALR